jgi:hypothetical protein
MGRQTKATTHRGWKQTDANDDRHARIGLNFSTERFIMNRKLATALVLAATAAAGNAFAGTGFAGDISIDTTPFVSSKTRAEVQAEVGQVRGISPWSMQYNPLSGYKSDRTRAEVTAQYLASRNQVAALTSEDSGSSYLAQTRVRNVGTTLAGQPQRNAQ